MSRRRRKHRSKQGVHANLFAALGDQTRLLLIAKLCGGAPRSIAELTAGSRVTRQAIAKHLRVLEEAGIVRSARAGREKQFRFNPQPMDEIKKYVETVSEQWDQALARLKAFVER